MLRIMVRGVAQLWIKRFNQANVSLNSGNRSQSGLALVAGSGVFCPGCCLNYLGPGQNRLVIPGAESEFIRDSLGIDCRTAALVAYGFAGPPADSVRDCGRPGCIRWDRTAS